MKAYLSKRYKGKVGEKVLQVLDLSVPLDFSSYCDMLERLLNYQQDKLKAMTFKVFDYNEDRQICQLDLYSVMKMYENDDQVFVEAFSFDTCKISAYLNKKQRAKGNINTEI